MTADKKAPLLDPLTEREMDIINLLAEGLTNREIAQRLILTVETIKWYNRQIYAKLAVGNRTEAVARAREIGLFDEPDQAAAGPSTPERLNNLPAQLSSFVGREEEILEVKDLLQTSRLVTLTGPGGAGKTRLGLAVAASELNNYANGVFFVPLLTAKHDSEVPKVIAHELGIVERPNRSLLSTIQRFLQNKELMLLLDNFEHVMPAVSLVHELLAAVPNLSILVTSRQALNLTGEHNYLVPPLRLPDPAHTNRAADLLPAESVTLFMQRARAASSNFHMNNDNAAAIAGICLRLDGLPLAIELAAARIKIFSPQQLLERLENRMRLLVGGPRDLPERQRTLRDTIDWSHNLLNETEKVLFARLSAFDNGRSLEAVESVCGFEPVADPITELGSLLEKSLLYQEVGPTGDPRFYMLETIQEYALEKLEQSGEKQKTQARHLKYFVSLVEEMEPAFMGQNQLHFLTLTEAEMGNIRVAFNWALANGKIEQAARLISAVDYYFRYKADLVEGYQLFKQLTDKENDIPSPYNVRFLLGAGRVAWLNNDIENSKRFLQKALKLVRPLKNKALEAWCLVENALIPDNSEEVLKYCQEGLALFKEQNHFSGMASALNLMGEITRLSGKNEQAKPFYEEALSYAEKSGEIIRQDNIKANLAFIAYQEGDYKHTFDAFTSIIKNRVKFRSWQWTITALVCMAGPLGHLGNPEKGVRLLGANAALMGDYSMDHQPVDQSFVALMYKDVQSFLSKKAFAKAWEEGQEMTLQEAVAYALDE